MLFVHFSNILPSTSTLPLPIQQSKESTRQPTFNEVLGIDNNAKARLCTLATNFYPCSINVQADIVDIVTDKVSGGLSSSQVSIVLSSNNFSELVGYLKSTTKSKK